VVAIVFDIPQNVKFHKLVHAGNKHIFLAIYLFYMKCGFQIWWTSVTVDLQCISYDIKNNAHVILYCIVILCCGQQMQTLA